MILINEWIPNPAGSDAAEWVELYNTGSSPVNLAGWHLKTSKGKPVAVAGTVPSHGYLILPRSQFKFTFRNTGESVALYDSANHLVDTSSFLISAPSGQSYSRDAHDMFMFTRPTPAAPNIIVNISIARTTYPLNAPLQAAPGVWGAVAVCLAVAALTSWVSYYIIRADHDISNLFFARD